MRQPLLPALLLGVAAITASTAAHAGERARVLRDGAFAIGSHQARCGAVRTELDRSLPNLGAAAPSERLLILNPRLMGRYSDTVQMFVFHHECGHHHVGGSETGADCWAVDRGVREGWLKANDLTDLCQSFGNAPETETHPSGRSRCAKLKQCFASVTTQVAKESGSGVSPVTTASITMPPPQLVSGPKLLWSSQR